MLIRGENVQNEAFEIIVNEYGPSVYRMALSKTGDIDTAQDIFQQVFLLLYEKQPTFTYKEQLKVWLMRATCKLASAERRRFDNSKTVPLDKAYAANSKATLAVEFNDLLSRLPENLADVTVLFYIEDMSLGDIAKTLDISLSAVKARLTRARKQLEKIYKEELL